MKIPKGLNEYLKENDSKVGYNENDCFTLGKSMYGLVQAARQFYKKVVDILVLKLGFEKCMSNQCLLKRKNDDGVVYVGLYIDDNLCCGDTKAINSFKDDIRKYFSTKEEGEMKEYVGCQVKRDDKNMWLYQAELIEKIEKYFGDDVKDRKEYDTPAGHHDHVVLPSEDDPILDEKNQSRYRSGIGMLLYLVKFSRPDISNSVRELSKANSRANDSHFKGLLRVIKYVISTRYRSLKYDKIEVNGEKMIWTLKAFCDSDWGGDKNNRKSITGYCIYLNENLVAWKSRSQKNVTLSSTEAEYVAVSEVCTEIMFIRSILEFMKVQIELPIEINCDNVGAIFLAYNAKTSARTKHVDIKYHFTREFIVDGIVMIKFVKSEENDSDIFTKNKNRETFHRHENKFIASLHDK